MNMNERPGQRKREAVRARLAPPPPPPRAHGRGAWRGVERPAPPARAGPFSGWPAPDVTSRVRVGAARGEVPAPPAQVGQSFVPGATP